MPDGEKRDRSIVADVTEPKGAEDAPRDAAALLKAVFRALPDLLLRVARDGTCLEYLVGNGADFLVEPSDPIGKRIDRVLPPQVARDLLEAMRQAIDTRSVASLEYSLDLPAKTKTFEARVVPFQESEAVAVIRDITERRCTERALYESDYFLRKTQEVARLGSYRLDLTANRWVSSAVLDELFGIDAQYRRDLEGWLAIVHPEQRSDMDAYLQRDVLGACKPFAREYRIVRIADGEERWVFGRGELELDDGGVAVALVGTVQDVTEHRRLAAQLAHDATHDALTGLLNRSELERLLYGALAAAQARDALHAFCYMDLDQFKVVNDTAGHAAGDELLKQIGLLLSGMVGERDALARIGGDELGLLLTDCPLERAERIAQRIVNRIRDHRFDWGGRSYRLGVSLGLVPIARGTESVAQILTQADVACYIAKQTGRNRVHLYRRENGQTAIHHNEILDAAAVRDAVEQGRFRLFYQPMVSLSDAGLPPVRYEALLRIVPEGNGGGPTLPPGFIGAAERFGLMDEIDRWVIETAFRDYGSGIGTTGAKLSINLSGSSLSDETLLPFIESRFACSDVPPDRVCFEITETAGIQNLHRALALMTALKGRGCEMALDDFGSGLSSFRYLKSLPVDYVKIDGGFVRNMLEDDSDRALVEAINSMSHTLGIRTVAEYVHSLGVVECLRGLQVDYAQGFYFGRPAPWAGAT